VVDDGYLAEVIGGYCSLAVTGLTVEDGLCLTFALLRSYCGTLRGISTGCKRLRGPKFVAKLGVGGYGA
jgi:hypothetical protein